MGTGRLKKGQKEEAFSEIDRWFSLETYIALGNELTPLELVDALYLRAVEYQKARVGLIGKYPDIVNAVSAGAVNPCWSFFSGDLYPEKFRSRVEDMIDPPEEQCCSDLESGSFASILPMTVDDLLSKRRKLLSGNNSPILAKLDKDDAFSCVWGSESAVDAEDIIRVANHLIDDATPVDRVDDSNTVTVTIDLDADNKDIEMELRSFLEFWRKRTGCQPLKRSLDHDIKAFKNNRTLAMVDLKLWSMVSDIRVTNPMIARLVFPNTIFEPSDYKRHFERVDRGLDPEYTKSLWVRAYNNQRQLQGQ
jgi:hypothetical protein